MLQHYDVIAKVLNYFIMVMMFPLFITIREGFEKKVKVWAILAVLCMALVIVEIMNGTLNVVDLIVFIGFFLSTIGGIIIIKRDEREAERKFMESLKKDYKVVSIVLDENSITDASEDAGKQQ